MAGHLFRRHNIDRFGANKGEMKDEEKDEEKEEVKLVMLSHPAPVDTL